MECENRIKFPILRDLENKFDTFAVKVVDENHKGECGNVASDAQLPRIAKLLDEGGVGQVMITGVQDTNHPNKSLGYPCLISVWKMKPTDKNVMEISGDFTVVPTVLYKELLAFKAIAKNSVFVPKERLEQLEEKDKELNEVYKIVSRPKKRKTSLEETLTK